MRKENTRGKVLETTVTVSGVLLSVLAFVPPQVSTSILHDPASGSSFEATKVVDSLSLA